MTVGKGRPTIQTCRLISDHREMNRLRKRHPLAACLLSVTAMLERFRIPVSWSDLLKRAFNETLADDVFNLAAQQAYYFFFALFPAILALISIASFFPIENLIGEIQNMVGRVAPPDVTAIITEQIKKIGESNAGGILTLAFLFTLWSSSSAVVSLCSTLNAAYDRAGRGGRCDWSPSA